jgi:hypothetical protein
MKRTRPIRFLLKEMAAAIAAAALMLGAADGATTVGLNFQSDAGPSTGYSGKHVTGTLVRKTSN